MPIQILPRELPKNIASFIGNFGAKLGIEPNSITTFGLVGTISSAWLVGANFLLTAGILYLFFSALDFVDGAVARASGKSTSFGAILDAVFDRAGETIMLTGCVWYFIDRGEGWQGLVALTAIFGSVTVSFVKSEGERRGIKVYEGFFRRQERVLILGIGLIANGLTVAIVVLALLANVTAVQRLVLLAIRRKSRPRTTT
tara:strand:- start:498 stop:1097 length:600 start_codon:yes stop_codon:yes gene_type:complete